MGKSFSRMSSAIFRTDLRAPHVFLAGAMVPAGTVLVTPGLDTPKDCSQYSCWAVRQGKGHLGFEMDVWQGGG